MGVNNSHTPQCEHFQNHAQGDFNSEEEDTNIVVGFIGQQFREF